MDPSIQYMTDLFSHFSNKTEFVGIYSYRIDSLALRLSVKCLLEWFLKANFVESLQ